MADKKPKGRRGHSDVKKGVLGKDDTEKLIANKDRMSVEELASLLDRSVSFIEKNLAKLAYKQENADKNVWIQKLHLSVFWSETRKGLVGGEQAYFEKAWAAYMDQFGSMSDILATDELMIKDLIMLDVLGNRAIADKADTIRRINTIDNLVEKEMSKPKETQDSECLALWRTQINSLNSAKVSLGKEHLDYQHKKDAKLRDLKGSRDQRFKQIEDSKKNLPELIKELDTFKSRQKEGVMAEKLRIAAEKVKEDWGHDMKYESGEYGKPFLCPEILEKDNKEN